MGMGGKLSNDLPEFAQQYPSIESFKQNYEIYQLIISSCLMCFFFAICLFLYHVSTIHSLFL